MRTNFCCLIDFILALAAHIHIFALVEKQGVDAPGNARPHQFATSYPMATLRVNWPCGPMHFSSTGFSLWNLVLARTKSHRLKLLGLKPATH
jgi:hypothetical protein